MKEIEARSYAIKARMNHAKLIVKREQPPEQPKKRYVENESDRSSNYMTINLATIGGNLKSQRSNKISQLDQDIQEELKEIEEAKMRILDSKLKIGINSLISGVAKDKLEQVNV